MPLWKRKEVLGAGVWWCGETCFRIQHLFFVAPWRFFFKMVGKSIYRDLFVGPNLSKQRKGDEKFQELEELMEGAGLCFGFGCLSGSCLHMFWKKKPWNSPYWNTEPSTSQTRVRIFEWKLRKWLGSWRPFGSERTWRGSNVAGTERYDSRPEPMTSQCTPPIVLPWGERRAW